MDFMCKTFIISFILLSTKIGSYYIAVLGYKKKVNGGPSTSWWYWAWALETKKAFLITGKLRLGTYCKQKNKT